MRTDTFSQVGFSATTQDLLTSAKGTLQTNKKQTHRFIGFWPQQNTSPLWPLVNDDFKSFQQPTEETTQDVEHLQTQQRRYCESAIS